MPIDFPTSPSSGQRYDYLSKSWIWNGVYWASVGASGNITSGQLGTPVVFSGNISSGQVSTFHLSPQSVYSGLIGSGIISTFKLSNEAIYSGAIASGQIPIFSLRSGLLISSSFGNESVGSGEILSGRINSPHIASGEINSFNMVSGIVNASNRLNSGSVFNLQPSSIISGLIGQGTIGTNDFINGAILSGNIANVSIDNTAIGSQEARSGNIASGQIFRFHTSSGFINSGHFGDAALSSGSFNIGCVNEYNLVSGFWVTPISQYVSGAISPYFFNNESITFNAFRTMSYVGAGYFIGNQNFTNYIILFSTEVMSSLNSANSLGRFAAAGIGGGNYNGYIAGGELGNNDTRLAEKLIYSAGTCYLVASANLSQTREKLTGITGDGTKGYFLGGCGYPSSPDYAIADKLTYSNDITVAQTTANLSQARHELASVSDMSTKGYAAGGVSFTTELATADKLTFSTDTTVAQTTANLSQARNNLAGCSGEGTKGYFAGGDSGNNNVATADKITYSTDTTAAQTTANLISPDQGMRGVSNGTTNGYLAYGSSGAGNKITYATDTTTAYTSANLTIQDSMATIDGYTLSPNDNFNQIVTSGKLTTTAANKVNSTNFADNSVLSGNINSNSIFSITGGYTPFTTRSVRSGAIPTGEIGPSHFARETLRSGNFSSGLLRLSDLLGDAARSGNIGERQIGQIHFGGASAGGTTRGGNQGYFVGGYSTNYTARADKTTYASDTTASQTTANLTTATAFVTGVSEGSTKGYIAGGDTISYVATAYKTTFSTDSTATQSSANLSQARAYLAGCSGEGTKGYFAGGRTAIGTATGVSTADKLTYSTDTTIAQTTANLSQSRQQLAGITEGSTKGYFIGGIDTFGLNSIVADKITFSNDTSASQTTANLSVGVNGLAGNSGDSTRGYVLGGNGPTPAARKITYATDTTTAQTSAFLSNAKYWATGITQGSTKGYVAGGFDDYSPQNTTDKITFSTDTTAAQTTANLSQSRYGAAGVEQYLTASAGTPTFLVTSSMVGSGSIDPSTSFAQTAGLNTNFPLFDSFVFQEQCSGFKAVCIASGGRVVRAQRASGLRLPAIGVTSGLVNSGATGRVFYLGGVGRTGTLAQNSGLNNGISGFQGLPLYVGSGGNIVNLSGMLGTSSGAAFLSGDMQQQIGIAISGGIFVMPSPRITRSGFQGNLPYNI